MRRLLSVTGATLSLLAAILGGCSALTTAKGDAGGTGGGNGGGADGGVERLPKDGPLGWTPMVIPSLGVSESLSAVHGRAVDDVYAVGPADLVLRWDGSTWRTTSVAGLGGGVGVYASSGGAVTVASKRALAHCSLGCDQDGVAFLVQALPNNRAATAVCGLGDADLYAVGTESLLGHGVLWRFQGGVWVEALSDLGVVGASSCWVAPSGTIYVAANREVIAVEGGGPITETVDLSSLTTTELLGHTWNVVMGVGTEVFVAGAGRRIARRGANRQWSLVSDPAIANGLYALAGASSHQLYAAGDGALNGFTLEQWQGGTNVWTPGGEPEAFASVRGLWAADVDTYFAVGWVEATPRIWFGAR